MKKFDLIVDEKVAIWRRNYVEVEAESLEEAIDKCLEESNDIDIIDSEYIGDTEESLCPDYNNPITIEVMDNDGNTLATNDR